MSRCGRNRNEDGTKAANNPTQGNHTSVAQAGPMKPAHIATRTGGANSTMQPAWPLTHGRDDRGPIMTPNIVAWRVYVGVCARLMRNGVWVWACAFGVAWMREGFHVGVMAPVGAKCVTARAQARARINVGTCASNTPLKRQVHSLCDTLVQMLLQMPVRMLVHMLARILVPMLTRILRQMLVQMFVPMLARILLHMPVPMLAPMLARILLQMHVLCPYSLALCCGC